MADALRAALEKRSLVAIQAALGSGSDIDATDDEGHTALALMCKSNSGEMSKTEVKIALWLIANNADVMRPNDDTETPLHLAAQSGSLEVVNALVAKGAKVSLTKRGSSPLHYCVSTGDKNTKLWDRLIALGCGLEDRTTSGDTPLLEAVSSDNLAAVKYLLAKGANPKVATNKGQTAVEMARSMGSPKIAKLLA